MSSSASYCTKYRSFPLPSPSLSSIFASNHAAGNSQKIEIERPSTKVRAASKFKKRHQHLPSTHTHEAIREVRHNSLRLLLALRRKVSQKSLRVGLVLDCSAKAGGLENDATPRGAPRARPAPPLPAREASRRRCSFFRRRPRTLGIALGGARAPLPARERHSVSHGRAGARGRA